MLIRAGEDAALQPLAATGFAGAFPALARNFRRIRFRLWLCWSLTLLAGFCFLGLIPVLFRFLIVNHNDEGLAGHVESELRAWSMLGLIFLLLLAAVLFALLVREGLKLLPAAGRWPTELAALAPEFLPAVPRHPFTGETILLFSGELVHRGKDGLEYFTGRRLVLPYVKNGGAYRIDLRDD